MLYREILGVEDLGTVELQTLMGVLQSDSMFERFAARKEAGMANVRNDFIQMKGVKG